jgi:transposase InsO family protein
MKLLARSYIHWKGIDRDIENLVKNCRECQLTQNEPAKVQIHHWEEPSMAWQRIHIDIAGPIQGFYLFIIVDAFSKWVEIIPTKNTTSTCCINKMEEIFATFGLPYVLVSDNGRQFIPSEYESYLKNKGITHKTSAPYHPATNGQAERYVQTIKKSLLKIQGERGDIYTKTLRIKTFLRRTPNSCGKSPYDFMFGREVRTQLHTMFKGSSERIPRDPTYHSLTDIRECGIGERVIARDYRNRQWKWQFGVVVERLGKLHYPFAKCIYNYK